MAVGTGVAVYGGASRAGDACHCFKAGETGVDGEIDQRLKLGACLGGDAVAVARESMRGEAQHQAAVTAIGDNEVGAAADHHAGEAHGAGEAAGGDEGVLILGLGIEIGRAADGEARIPGERGALQNG